MKKGNVELDLQNEIQRIFGIQKQGISDFQNLRGSNHVYSFVVENQKYVIRKLIQTSIVDWRQEQAAYNSLKPYNITDELVYCDNGIKITKFLDNSETLSCGETDLIDALDQIRKVHDSGVSIDYNYDIAANIDKYIVLCNKKSKRLKELMGFRNRIDSIQAMLNNLHIPPVLCHGDACATANFLRLPDNSIRIIDWEQAGMADPLLDIAIAVLHQGFEKIDPVWCLHQYLKRVPNEQEYFRLFSFLALDSYALMAWCIYQSPEGYDYYLDSAAKYSGLVLRYYVK